MTATTKFKSRAAILACLSDQVGLTGVAIGYNHLHAPAESISLGPTIEQDVTEPRSISQTPVKSEETYELGLIVFIASQSTVARNEERADEILEHVMTAIATTPRLGLEDYGFMSSYISQVEIISGEVADEGPQTRIDVTINCKGRI